MTFNEELGQLPPDLNLGATSDQIMRRGRRIRRIRQSAVAGTAAVAVVGVMATGVALSGRHSTQVVHPAAGGLGLTLSSPSQSPSSASAVASLPAAVASLASPSPSYYTKSAAPGGGQLVGSGSTISTASCSPGPQSDAGAPAANTDGNAPAWGTSIPAGTDSGKSIVLYGVHVSDSAIPCTHFGVMLGTTGSAGGVTGVYEANESAGSDLAPGMHAVSLASGVDQLQSWYLLGYYVGPAATVAVDEKALPAPVAATVVPWSVNPDVKIWWVSGTGAVPAFGNLSAKDASGTALPIGTHGDIGVG